MGVVHVHRVLWVVGPPARVVENILSNAPKTVLVPDDVLVVVTLPTAAPGVWRMLFIRFAVAVLNEPIIAPSDPDERPLGRSNDDMSLEHCGSFA